jgi:CheY-like chemotaxis protein
MWVGSIVDVHEIVTLATLTSRALEEERLARADAERVTRLRDEFMALVSHELRSPLSAITGWADILVRKDGTDPMIAKAGAVIHRNAQLQAALINDLLDMSAMMAGKLVLNTEPVDLSALAREVVLSHLHSAQQKGLGLVAKAAAPAIVDGDNRRLTQVLNNLVSNAIKFTPAGGNVRVEVAVHAGQAVLEVRDNGRGISPSFLPHVFERMRQEDGSGGRAGGLGLGLAIAKGIVELHGGTITVNSAGAGQGTSVSVAVPIVAEMEAFSALASSARRGSSDADLNGMRVLLVDDEQDARDVAQVALTSLGARVTVASSGAQALELLKSGRVFDVLLSDVGMPQMDGLALVRAVRAHPAEAVRSLPAVALTAFALESDVQAGLNAGFHDYVAKPISIRRLSEAIVGVTTGAPAAAN